MPDLLERLRNREDRFVERKLEGVNSADIRKTLVAFANSLHEGEEGILFIGISDTGDLRGVSNTDKLQKTVSDLARNDCYPAIEINLQVITQDGMDIVAVSIPASRNRPHFAGPAFVRIGSESVRASEAMFTDLIASRTDQGRLLLKYRDEGTEIVVQRIAPWNPQNETFRTICKVIECNPYYAVFQEKPGGTFSLEINYLSVRWEGSLGKPLVTERRG